ncbi:MAG: hypothetical protein A2579_02580 [Lysobacterales bacterium RIFOXYD1_FULL_69_11]|nr:MAG: hypothetical protein A2190_07595 [Xanthomonadales bacterium RIFOXYA1_FULL_69_10]OHE86043.1 MAG: hypothetical protein A2579_02580 [Xanthomonadales bacterium RIFOXYD1_FULL_69_11]
MVLAVAIPVRAEQADATMGVGLRIVASDRTTTGRDPDGNRNRPGAKDTVDLAHGQVVVHGERARIERAHDRAGRPIDVVTY